jgi:hypothetical protein
MTELETKAEAEDFNEELSDEALDGGQARACGSGWTFCF